MSFFFTPVYLGSVFLWLKEKQNKKFENGHPPEKKKTQKKTILILKAAINNEEKTFYKKENKHS